MILNSILKNVHKELHFIGSILIEKEKNSMNYGRCIIFGNKECKKTPAMSLSELESAVFEITRSRITYQIVD